MTHICVGKQTIIGSDNGLSPGRRQAIISTNAGILLIGPFGTNFSEISIKILTFSFTKMRLKVSSAKWRPFCLGLNVLMIWTSLCLDFLCDLLYILYNSVLMHWQWGKQLFIFLYSPWLLHWHCGNQCQNSPWKVHVKSLSIKQQ